MNLFRIILIFDCRFSDGTGLQIRDPRTGARRIATDVQPDLGAWCVPVESSAR